MNIDDRQIAGRILRQTALNAVDRHVLVALVLDGDGGIATIAADLDGIRLTAELDPADNALSRDVHHQQPAAGIHEIIARIDRDQRQQVADHLHGGRLAAYRDTAERRRFGRIGDVDEPDRFARAVGIDERLAVLGGGDDLGDGLLADVLRIEVQIVAERRNALKVHANRVGSQV
ncbi:hypothetical protein [Thiorhodococcus fuscus]|uniref:Uncharacterized protein n=1 Tax=Thiorhodococcus fuscus TaxID=527200 RepID=A0ABW4Y4X2_9GAMM